MSKHLSKDWHHQDLNKRNTSRLLTVNSPPSHLWCYVFVISYTWHFGFYLGGQIIYSLETVLILSLFELRTVVFFCYSKCKRVWDSAQVTRAHTNSDLGVQCQGSFTEMQRLLGRGKWLLPSTPVNHRAACPPHETRASVLWPTHTGPFPEHMNPVHVKTVAERYSSVDSPLQYECSTRKPGSDTTITFHSRFFTVRMRLKKKKTQRQICAPNTLGKRRQER